MSTVTLHEGDLLEEKVEALVIPAATDLGMDPGIAAKLRSRGGSELEAAWDALGPAALGTAVATPAGQLDARYVFYAAVAQAGDPTGEDGLRNAFRACLQLAREKGVTRLAAPAMGAGDGGLSLQRSAEILLEEARAHFAGETCISEIRFVVIGEPAYRVFEMVNDAAKVAEQMARLARRS